MTTQLSKQQRLEIYHYLKLNRLVEERLANLYRQGKVVGGLYRSLGQEACSVAPPTRWSGATSSHRSSATSARSSSAAAARATCSRSTWPRPPAPPTAAT